METIQICADAFYCSEHLPAPFLRQIFVELKPHSHGRLFCNAIRIFFMRENLSPRAFTHTRRDSLAAIAFRKNRRRVSTTCDANYILHDSMQESFSPAITYSHEVDFNVSRVPGQSCASVNSKSYAIYESPWHSAMHKCFASR